MCKRCYLSSQIYESLFKILIREKRDILYKNTIKFINSRVDLDLALHPIFGHIKCKKLENIAKDVVQFEINALKNLKRCINPSFNKIVNILINCKNGKVIISGVGKRGLLQENGLQLFHQLVHLPFSWMH